MAEFGSPEGGGSAPRQPGNGYWDKLLQPAAPVSAPGGPAAPLAPAPGLAPQSEDQPFELEQTPIGGYLGLVVAVVVLTAIDNRDGSRWYFACAAVLVVLTGALLYWWRSQFAPMRVDLTHNGQILSIIMARRTAQIPVTALTWIDQKASPVAQFFAWRELTLHHLRGRIRIGRPQDTRDFYWQLGRLNPALPPEPPPTEQRPWIVNVAVGVVGLSAVGAIAFALKVLTLDQGGAFGVLGLILLLSGLAQLALCYSLWAGYRGAWRFFIVLAVVDVVLTLMWSHYSVVALCFQIISFCLLTSPGVRRWVSD